MFLSSRRQNLARYEPVVEKSDEDSYSEQTNQTLVENIRKSFWFISTWFFAGTTTVLLWLLLYNNGRDFENGFDNELGSATSVIEIVKIPFSGELVADENGQWMRNLNLEELQYAGPPSDALDKAWQDLIAPINIDLREDEARDISETYVWPDTNLYSTGLSVHHYLHCLNIIRMAVYKDYYLFPEDKPHREFKWLHIDHCIDFLRQAIQCQGDLTPMIWYWSENINRTILKAEAPRTCRKWDRIQDWAVQRIHNFTEEEKSKTHSAPLHGVWSP